MAHTDLLLGFSAPDHILKVVAFNIWSQERPIFVNNLASWEKAGL
jgi:hypothetical protein